MAWIVAIIACNTASPTPPTAEVAACGDRVELPEAAGECQVDEDCVPTGCSREVCAAVGVALITTCEVEPCFARLDRCVCAEGRCAWTLK